MLLAILGGLLFDGFWGNLGTRDLIALRQHSRLLERERDRLFQDNVAFRKRIAQLSSDDVFLQQLIRQELGYVRPDELIYRFPNSQSP
jgi:cell division protein FtsB